MSITEAVVVCVFVVSLTVGLVVMVWIASRAGEPDRPLPPEHHPTPYESIKITVPQGTSAEELRQLMDAVRQGKP